jgi:phage/plasmid-associated DNA primase
MARGFLHIGGKENLCDDIANAIRYAHLFPFLKYDERGGKEGWRYWDGVRWRDGNAEAVDHAMRVSDYISEEAAQIASDNEITSKQLFRWAKQSRMNGKIMAILNIAQKSTVCRLSADTGEAWDEKGYHLGMSTGVFEIDGRGKVTGQEARDLYVSMSTRGNILTDDEGSLRWGDKWNRCREFWFTLLSQWQPGADRVEVISMLQEIAGMSLRGRLDEAVFVLQGSGRSGKSALLDGLSHTLGDYAYEVSGDVFVRGTKSGGGASSNMRDASKFQMDKKRMIKITEVGGRQLDVDMLKQATGETTITGRALYAQPSTATMHGTFWMMTNQELDLRGDASEALRGRLWLIEFPTTFVHESRLSEDAYRSGVADGTVLAARDDIKDRLRGLEPSFEAMPDVILTWAYEGLVRVIKRGSLSIARSVRERTSAMWSTTDLLGTYWNESGLWMPGGVTAVTTRGLYNNIKSWAEREDPDLLERIAGVQQLGDYLKTRAALGFNRHRTTKALWSNGNQLEGWDVPYTWQQIREV